VVVVDVAELVVEHRVELDREDVVAGRPGAVGGVEEAQVLERHGGGEAPGARDEEGQPVAAQVEVLPDDGEHERRREGPHRASAVGRRLPELERGRVQRVACHGHRAVGEHEEAAGRHPRGAVDREARDREAVVGELAGAGGCRVLQAG